MTSRHLMGTKMTLVQSVDSLSVENVWRPLRDLNSCLLRERGLPRFLLKFESLAKSLRNSNFLSDYARFCSKNPSSQSATISYNFNYWAPFGHQNMMRAQTRNSSLKQFYIYISKFTTRQHQAQPGGSSMARINIEDSVFKDKRFTNLCIILGSRTLALGALVEAFMFSQEYASADNPECLAPLDKFEKEQLPKALIDTGWVEVRDDKVYVSGSKECHAWLIQKKAAGSKGGQKSSKSATRRSSGGKRKQAAPSGGNPLTLTPSLTPSLSSSSSSRVPNSPAEEPSALNRKIWNAYSEAYFARYKTEPVRNKTVNSKIKQIGERLGDEAPDVVRFFVEHNKTYYVSKLHEIGICLQDAESLRTQWARGKPITTADIKNFERQVERDNLLQLIEEGKI